jgi:hypothetical protein
LTACWPEPPRRSPPKASRERASRNGRSGAEGAPDGQGGQPKGLIQSRDGAAMFSLDVQGGLFGFHPAARRRVRNSHGFLIIRVLNVLFAPTRRAPAIGAKTRADRQLGLSAFFFAEAFPGTTVLKTVLTPERRRRGRAAGRPEGLP